MAEARGFASSSAPNTVSFFTEPSACDDLLFSEELDACLSMHMQIAKKRIAPTAKRKPCHGCWHANVKPNHACFHSMLKLARRFARVRKNRGPVSVGRAIHGFDGGIEIIYPHHVEHGTEYLLARDRHSGLHFIQNSGREEKAIRRAVHFDGATVGRDFRSFIDAGFD